MAIERIGGFGLPYAEVSGRRTFARMLRVRTNLPKFVNLKEDIVLERDFGPNANTHAMLVFSTGSIINASASRMYPDKLNTFLSEPTNRDMLINYGFSVRQGKFNQENLYQAIVGKFGDGDIFESKYGDEHEDIARSISAILDGEGNAWDFINTERAEKVVGLFAETWPVKALENAHRFSGQTWAEGIIKSIAEIEPGWTLYHSRYFIDQPWAEGVVQLIGEKHPRAALNYARRIIDQPWAGRVITPALRKESSWPTKYINTFTDDELAIDVIRLVDKTDADLVDYVLKQVFESKTEKNEASQKIRSSANEHRGERWAIKALRLAAEKAGDEN